MPHNPAKTLKDQIWGQDWINAIPAKFRSALKYLNFKTPGVDNSTQPDPIGVDGVINSQVVTNRTNEREKTTSQLDGDVIQHVYHDQDYDEVFDVVIPIDRYLTEEGAEQGEPRRKIEGLVPGIDSVETLSIDTSVLDDYVASFPGVTRVEIPDILSSLRFITEETIGAGESNDDVLWSVFAGEHSLTIPSRVTAQGSAVMTAEVIPDIIPFWGSNRDVTQFLFFMPIPITRAQVVTKLGVLAGGSVVSWPLFNPRYVTIVMVSKRVSLQVSAQTTFHETVSSGGTTDILSGGTGYSKEVGITVKTVRIPPTIHGDLTSPFDTSSGGSGLISSTGGGLVVSAATLASYSFGLAQAMSLTENPSLSISAFGLDPTGGDSALPGSGLLIVDVNVRPYKYGYAMVQATVIDAATL